MVVMVVNHNYMRCPACKHEFSAREAKMITLPMHRYYFGVIIEILSEHTGYTKEQVDKLLKEKFLFEILHIPTKFGIQEVKIVRSKTELTTQEANEFYSQIRIWASCELEPSCWIPEPNEVANEG